MGEIKGWVQWKMYPTQFLPINNDWTPNILGDHIGNKSPGKILGTFVVTSTQPVKIKVDYFQGMGPTLQDLIKSMSDEEE